MCTNCLQGGFHRSVEAPFSRQELMAGLILKSDTIDTAATFKFTGPDFTFWKHGSDGIVTINIDRKGNYGPKVTKTKARHLRKQFKQVEAVIDEVTGDAFDFKFTKKHKHADLKAYVVTDETSLSEGSRAFWSNAHGVLAWERYEHGKPLSEQQILTTLSHEVGHVVGLDHPENYDHTLNLPYPNTVMGGYEPLINLTPGDLDFVSKAWENTWEMFYVNL